VVLTLDMPVRYSVCDERVEANRGRVAVTRGPLVYCAEEVDNAGPVQSYYLPEIPGEPQVEVDRIPEGPLADMPVLQLPAKQVGEEVDPDEPVRLVPYFAWNNRGNASMIVWFPTSRKLAAKSRTSFDPKVFAEVTASSYRTGQVPRSALNGERPQSSEQEGFPYWSSEDGDASPWLEMRFRDVRNVERVAVFWAQEDTEDVSLPQEWCMDVLEGGIWKEFEPYITCFYGTKADTYNVMYPASVRTVNGVRIRVTPPEGKRVGIMDIDVTMEKPR
jgi:hypothetical protein